MPFDRRRFLIASGVTGGLAAATTAGVVSYRELHHSAAQEPLAGGGVLVVVTLYGGNDGLNMVIPVEDPAYRAARGELAYSAEQALPLTDGFALHPAMTGLRKLWDDHRLAIIRGVGYPKPDHSHFRSMAIWQTASPETASTTGWLGRWLDAQAKTPAGGSSAPGASSAPAGSSSPGSAAALRVVSVGPTLAPLVVGATTAAAAVPTGPFTAPGGAIGQELRQLYRPDPVDGPLAARVASSGADLFTVAGTLGPVLAGQADQDTGPAGQLDGGGGDATAAPAAGTATSPPASATVAAAKAGELGAQLDVVAACIRAGVPTRAYSVNLGGFDTHIMEKATQAKLLGELDAALTRFQAAIVGDPHGTAVTTVVYSEFGRRVAANANDGTDHGTAAPVLVLGTNVRGGFHGDAPSLTNLDDGDLRFTTDFRSVYATLLERVLGTEAGVVLGSQEHFPRLAFL
ncbi:MULTISPECIES: DUF1501 domain-containing protein [unclassified Pseudofrankia]|uniref:DUF1501 domain-containing protein n=1 Tax=unclassified Pseudofrankia TaxID=2994372 RepID=UPI0008D93B07|nr:MULTISPECIES: DUF1501 domain-containing protein [unclassified Pseudofrankia]MDT3442380.1 DUF1501 domain-containing protein [Pseudofrankia sp. BMG5.37]OHV47873.1 hypothetical protein BCD48_17155 [Pseudofrankia sp. BMG5.36]